MEDLSTRVIQVLRISRNSAQTIWNTFPASENVYGANKCGRKQKLDKGDEWKKLGFSVDKL